VLMSYKDLLDISIIRPATVCGLSPRMRTDVSVNMMAMQALENGVMTVYGGAQMRPSIHIDDLTDLYEWLLTHDVCGTYNAGFENMSLLEIAQAVQEIIPSEIEVTPEKDRRSYQVNSDKLLRTGFTYKKTVRDAIVEIRDAYQAGTLRADPQWNNLDWMRLKEITDE